MPPAVTSEAPTPVKPEGKGDLAKSPRGSESALQRERESQGTQDEMKEIREQIKAMTPEERKQFFDELSRRKGKPELPSFEIAGADEGAGKIRAGKGPYSVVKRQHPDWDHKRVNEEAQRIKKETGRKSFSQGEEIKTNEDGSVSIRTPDRKKPGSFTDVTSKDGKPTSIMRGDGKGNFESEQFDKSGKKTGSVKRVQGEGNNFTETKKDADGKDVSTKVRTQKPDGSYSEKETDLKTDNFVETSYDKNGKKTGSVERVHADGGTYQDTTRDAAGKVVTTMAHMVRADGTVKEVTRDANGKEVSRREVDQAIANRDEERRQERERQRQQERQPAPPLPPARPADLTPAKPAPVVVVEPPPPYSYAFGA